MSPDYTNSEYNRANSQASNSQHMSTQYKGLESKLSSTLVLSSIGFGVLTVFIGWEWWQISQAIGSITDYPNLGQLAPEALKAANSLKRDNLYLGIAYFLVISVTIYTTHKIKTFVAHEVVDPLQSLTSAAAKVGQGELNFPIPRFSDGDEIGSLTSAFDTMVTKLREDTSRITEAIDVLSSSVGQIVISTSQSAASSSQTAATVTETTVSAEEVRQTTMVATQKGRFVADLAQQAAQISLVGKNASEDTINQMTSVRHQMRAIANSMATLTDRSQAIADITASVDELSQQSNLLAVNASIEAARAGEMGKGFGVVAQEVKALSNQSKQATAEVRRILSDIQQAAAQAALSIEEGSRTVEVAVKQSAEAGRAIESLAHAVAESANAAAQIAAASQEQLTGIDQVVTAMQGIQEATKQHVLSSKQIDEAAKSLTAIQDVLETLVCKYKLK